MKNMLVPVDFSTVSLNAVNYAVPFARSFGAALHIMNVIPLPTLVDDPVLASALVAQTELMETNQRLMNEKIESLSKTEGINITGSVTEGFPSDIITEIAGEKKVDLIIMGIKGKGKSNSIFGSTVTAVIRKSGFPVLVIPEEADFQPLRHITFACDFDPDIKSESYDLLTDLASGNNIPVTILNVQRNDSVMDVKTAIGKLNTSLAFSKIHPQFHSVYEKNIEEGIDEFIKNNRTDMLAMVAHPHSLFKRIFGTIHTKEMGYQTKIPLLILPDKQKII